MQSKSGTGTRHIRWEVWASITVIVLMSLLGVFAPDLAPHDPTQMQVGLSNYPPAWYDSPSRPGQPDHLLGTDLLGRDIFSHVIYGARAAMFLVLSAIPLSVLIGGLVGVIAGLGNRYIETIFLLLSDIVSSVPSFMFAVILVLILRATPTGLLYGGLITLMLAFALVNWVSLGRLLYTSVLSIRSLAFMEAARSLGATPLHQTFRHILPHLSHLIIVWIVSNIPAVILLEALLGYVGIQILPVTDGSSFQDLSWGGLVMTGRTQLIRNPFILLTPALCILAISISFATLGEYLNERLNPQFDASQLH